MSDEVTSRLDWFTAYVASGRAPRWTMAPADLHGFLLGLSMAGSLPDSEWVRWVWSGETPVFASRDEEWSVMSDLLEFEAQVRNSLNAYRIVAPSVLPSAGHGWFHAADWAEGFLQAIEANPAPWRRAVDVAEASLTIVLKACYHNHETGNDGLISADDLSELNYHLRHLNRIMRAPAGYAMAA